jgi:ribosomal protein L11 methyltransferase
MMPIDDSTDPDLLLLVVRIRVARQAAAAVEEFLWTLDPGAVGHVVAGDEAELTVTLPAGTVAGLGGSLAAFLGEAGLDTPVTVATVAYREEDWLNAYRQEFEPIFIRDRLVVAPTWWEAPLPAGGVTLRIDPQMAFGTGHHPTTHACLEWLVRRADALGSMPGGLIDAGCGSGLLAIAAHHLGFAPVVAIDNDPVACATTRDNAVANDAAAIRVIDGDLATAPLPTVPTLVANLTAGTIMQLFPVLAGHVTAAGQIYLAGILPEQEETLTSAIRHWGWQIGERHLGDGWLSLAVQPGP